MRKGGTKALLSILDGHPGLVGCKKEVHFFDLNFRKGWEWYAEQVRVYGVVCSIDGNWISAPYIAVHAVDIPIVPDGQEWVVDVWLFEKIPCSSYSRYLSFILAPDASQCSS